jgi:exonuclease III
MVSLRVTSYNMRQGGSHEHWSRILSATEPDLLLVQETKDPTTFSGDLLEPLNLRGVLWHSAAQNRWGSALFYRGGEVAEIPIPGFQGWVAGGEAKINGEAAYLFSVHLPPSAGSYLKTAHRLMDELAPIIGGTTCVIGGDWNFTACLRDPGDPRGHKRGEPEFIHRMADDFGLVPSWRLAHPDGELPQTLRWTGDPRTPYHCDGIFVPSGLSGRPMRAQVHSGTPWLNLSDHNPIEVEWDGPLNVNPAAF